MQLHIGYSFNATPLSGMRLFKFNLMYLMHTETEANYDWTNICFQLILSQKLRFITTNIFVSLAPLDFPSIKCSFDKSFIISVTNYSTFILC